MDLGSLACNSPMRALASTAKVNLGAATYHFGSKKELYIETFLRRFRPTNAERLRLLQEAQENGKIPSVEKIVDCMTKMNISATVSEADIGQVRNGQSVDFTVDAFPDETFHGVVKQVRRSPTTTQNVVTYETIIAVENPELKLFPGMTAELSIFVAQRTNAIVIPNTALRYAPPEHGDPTLRLDQDNCAGSWTFSCHLRQERAR